MKYIDLLSGYEEYNEYNFLAIDANEEIQYLIEAWEGFVDEVFRKPDLSGNGWSGFTKLYHECILTDEYDKSNPYVVLDNEDFYKDLLYYSSQERDIEANALYEALIELSKEAIDKKYKILITLE